MGKHGDDHGYRDFPILIAGSLVDPPPTVSPAVSGSSIGPIPKSVLGRLRRIRRTSRARASAPEARSASVTAIGPAFTRSAARAARVAEAGMVKIHAHTIRRATPHRTALNRRVAPAPMTEPDTTCVVLTGSPHMVASCMTDAATVWAANPWIGSIRMILIPIVLMMRQPPAHVPSPIASAAASATQVGTANSEICPELNRARVMIAIVFCASLAPWLNATKPLEKSWSLRNTPLAWLGRALLKRLRSTTARMYATTSPAIGEVRRAMKTG